MPWDVNDSSGILAHFVGTVQTSVWTTDANRQDPNKPFLMWEVTVDDVLQDNFEGTVPETRTINLSIGKGWINDEAGETVEHEDGDETFRASTLYGKVIALVIGKADDLGNNAVIMDGGDTPDYDLSLVKEYMQDKGFDDPRIASIWEGITFEFRGVGFKYRSQDGDPFQNVIPVRCVTVPGSDTADTTSSSKAKGGAKAQASEASKPEPTPAVNTVEIWTAAGADDELAMTLDKLANSTSSHTQFAKEALALDDVKGNPTLLALVMEEANYPG